LLHTEGFRLSASYAAVFAVSVLVMGSIMLFIAQREFRHQVVTFSRGEAVAIQRGFASEGIPEALEVVEQLIGAPGSSDYLLLQKGTKRLAGNLPPMEPREGTVSLPSAMPGHEILGSGIRLSPDVYVFAGSDTDRSQRVLKRMAQLLAWLFGAALLVAAAGGALVSRSFLHRTDAMAKACRAIMDGDMKARIPLRGTQDELDRLANTINDMLDRIVQLMENLRQVTNDIAHDLRTPVAHLRYGLERALADAVTPDDHAQALAAAIAKSDQILALFAAMLRIAQIEGGARRAAFAPIELAELLAQMRDLFSAVAEESGDRLDIDVAQGAVIRGDRELLVQLLSNLVENAILHTPPGTEIVLVLRVSGGRAVVTARDNGPGVPAEEQAKLFQRFYRREASRSQPGYGLGLSLVAAVAELHNAALTVVPQPGPGLAVEISFPLAADA